MITPPAFLDGTALCARRGVDPDLFHSSDKRHEDAATAICGRCPLRTACADHALTAPELHGTWGGLTVRQRARILNPDDEAWLDDQGRVRRACGSYAALMAHIRYGETCQRCQTAQEQRTEANRRQQLEREHQAGGSPAGAAIHKRLGEEPCQACRAAIARRSAARRAAAHKPAQQPMEAAA